MCPNLELGWLNVPRIGFSSHSPISNLTQCNCSREAQVHGRAFLLAFDILVSRCTICGEWLRNVSLSTIRAHKCSILRETAPRPLWVTRHPVEPAVGPAIVGCPKVATGFCLAAKFHDVPIPDLPIVGGSLRVSKPVWYGEFAKLMKIGGSTALSHAQEYNRLARSNGNGRAPSILESWCGQRSPGC